MKSGLATANGGTCPQYNTEKTGCRPKTCRSWMAALKSPPMVKIGDEPRPVKFHGSLALIDYDKHPDEAKLPETLDDFDLPAKRPQK